MNTITASRQIALPSVQIFYQSLMSITVHLMAGNMDAECLDGKLVPMVEDKQKHTMALNSTVCLSYSTSALLPLHCQIRVLHGSLSRLLGG